MTYIKKFSIKRVSADIDEARIVSWAVAPGAAFKKGDTLLEIETDKSVIEVAADDDGVLAAQLHAEGDTVGFDVPIAELELDGEAPPEQGADQDAASAEVPATTEVPATAEVPATEVLAAAADTVSAPPTSHTPATSYTPAHTDTDRPVATPAARNMAAELALDLRRISGSGPGGRITRSDITALAKGGAGSAGAAAASASPPAGAAGRMVSTRHGAINVKTWPPRKPSATPTPTVVLLHGLFGDMDTWAAMASTLTAAGMNVMALDLPNHGDSPSNATTLDQVVEGVIDVLEQSVTGPMALIGHSFGAAVAARVASTAGDRLQSLTLQSLIMLAPVGLGTEIGQSFLSGMTNAQTEEAIARELRKLTESSASLSPPYLRILQARLHERHQVLNALCASLARNGVQQIDISTDLAAIRRPMAIIHGRNDGIVPWSHVLNAPPRAALHLIPGVGHMPQWEAPGLTAEIILSTLART